MAADKNKDKANAVNNLEVWEKLCVTNPEYTKEFDNGRFKGTAINPVYVFWEITKLFGPVGFGWKFNVIEKDPIFLPDGTILTYIDVDFQYKLNGEWSEPVRGSGGDFIARVTKNGIKPDDDARKKAITDALTNATKFLGKSADVHMGYFDDPEYKVDLAEKFSDEEPWADRSAKIFVWELCGIISASMTEKAIDDLLDREKEHIFKLANFLKENLSQITDSRKQQIKNGVTPPKLKGGKYFVDVQHALDWCAAAKKRIEESKISSMLEDWFAVNESLIDGLNVDLKAAKYLVGGKGRGTVLKEFYLSKLKQLQPLAAE